MGQRAETYSLTQAAQGPRLTPVRKLSVLPIGKPCTRVFLRFGHLAMQVCFWPPSRKHDRQAPFHGTAKQRMRLARASAAFAALCKTKRPRQWGAEPILYAMRGQAHVTCLKPPANRPPLRVGIFARPQNASAALRLQRALHPSHNAQGKHARRLKAHCSVWRRRKIPTDACVLKITCIHFIILLYCNKVDSN